MMNWLHLSIVLSCAYVHKVFPVYVSSLTLQILVKKKLHIF